MGIGLANPQHKLDVNGGAAAAFDTDAGLRSYFGRAALGYAGHSDEMTISRVDRNSVTDYALFAKQQWLHNIKFCSWSCRPI